MISSDDQHVYKNIKHTATVSSGFTGLVGVLGLLGWISGLKVLTSIRVSYISISISTCALFILFSILMLLYIYISSYISLWILLIPTCAVTFLLILLLPFGFGVTWTLNSDISPLLISPMTSLLAILVGISLSLLFVHSKNKLILHLIGALAIIIIITSLVISVSYVYATPLLYGLPIIPMALTTSIGFIFFGIGLIALTGPSGLLSYLAGSSVRAMLYSELFDKNPEMFDEIYPESSDK